MQNQISHLLAKTNLFVSERRNSCIGDDDSTADGSVNRFSVIGHVRRVEPLERDDPEGQEKMGRRC
jgi:hypothetical protein